MSSVASGNEAQERLLTGYSGRMATTLAVGWMALLLGRQAISPLLPAIIVDLQITPAMAGFALTLMTGLYALLQFPGGRLSDQVSRTAAIATGIGVLIAGFLALINAVGYPGFLAGVALVGIGGGLFFSPSRAFIADLFVERRGQAYGLQTGAGMLGGVLAATSAAAVLAVATWRVAFVPPVGLLLVVLVGLLYWSREPATVSGLRLELRSTSVRLFGSRRIRWLILGFTLFEIAAAGFIGFLPTLLQLSKGFSPTLASGVFALVYAVGVVVGPSAGRASDWFHRTHVIVSAPLLGALGILVLLATTAPALATAGSVMTAVGLWSYFPSVNAYLGDILADENLGGDFGFLKSVYTGLGSVGPTYVGVVAGEAGYPVAFAGLAACLVASATVLFVGTRS